MKNHYSFLILLFLSLSIYAQSPEKMSYQAVVRDANNTLVANQTVGMRISILQSTITGIVVYTETHSVDTNMNGLVSLEIGNGSSSDDFSTIDWSAGPYFIKTETDPSGGTSYSIISTSQFLSVPYALYAKTSEGIATKPEYLYCELNGLINGNTFMGLYFKTPMPPFNLYGSVVNGISYNATDGEITLKAGKTYQLEGSAKILSTTLNSKGQSGGNTSGGGGGGYFGGGGGGDNRGGGGGSGYFGALSNGSTSGSSHGTLYPPNTADLVYPGTSNPVAGSGSVGTAGDGASSGNSTGGDGFIVMQWSTVQVINNADSDYLAIDSENSGKWAAYPSSQNLGFLLEKTFYSDPKLSDSDGDGFGDNVEYDAGTDPDSNTSIPTLAYGLIAWYPFDGNASDMSGNGRNATAVNTHSYVSAKVGNGVRIVGSDSSVAGHVMLPYISSLENADTTFAFWVLEEAMLQSHGEAYLAYGQIESVLNYSGGQPFSFSSSTSYIAGITRSAWNHYTVTKIGSVKKEIRRMF